MAELIYKGAFIEDIKTEIVNLSMDGLKGTPRERSYLYEMIDRINEQPTTTESEIRAKAIDEFLEEVRNHAAVAISYNRLSEIAEQFKTGMHLVSRNIFDEIVEWQNS